MGLTFNLNNVNGTATVRLKPWGIYDVVLKSIELVSGTNKEGKTWKGLKLKFSGEQGVFEPVIFCPADNDERPHGESDGNKWELPSSMEVLQCAIAHIVKILAPDMQEKLIKGASGLVLPDEFEKLVKILNTVLSKSFNKQTKIKIAGDNKGYATLPKYVSINKDGEAYLSNNWLGDNLAFTASEVKSMEKQKNAKPTDMKASEDKLDETDTDNSDLDFDV